VKKRSLMLFTVLFLLLISSYCCAYDFDVETSNDFRNALSSAETNGESDTITLFPGTYETGGSPFNYAPSDAEGDLTIIGSGDVILDAGGNDRVLFIGPSAPSPADFTLQNLTIQSGDAISAAGTCLTMKYGTINVINCSFRNNSASVSRAGGLSTMIESSGTINITSCDFVGNHADGEGGGLYAWSESADITLLNNSFSDNSGTSGGGAWINTLIKGNCLVTGNTFSQNASASNGGGIRTYINGGTLYFSNNILQNNSIPEESSGYGGGAYLWCKDDLTVQNCYCTNNTAGGNGGGLYAYSGSGNLIFRNNLVTNNTTFNKGGGAFCNTGGTGVSLDVINNTITGNSASDDQSSYCYCGGLFVECQYQNSVASIYNNILWGNTSYQFEPSGGPDNLYLDDNENMSSFKVYHNVIGTYATDLNGGSI